LALSLAAINKRAIVLFARFAPLQPPQSTLSINAGGVPSEQSLSPASAASVRKWQPRLCRL
jgi:hypothetical protein